MSTRIPNHSQAWHWAPSLNYGLRNGTTKHRHENIIPQKHVQNQPWQSRNSFLCLPVGKDWDWVAVWLVFSAAASSPAESSSEEEYPANGILEEEFFNMPLGAVTAKSELIPELLSASNMVEWVKHTGAHNNIYGYPQKFHNISAFRSKPENLQKSLKQ